MTMECLLSDSRGIYIPQHFAETMKLGMISGVDPENWKILLKGPDQEWYWEAWEDVLDNGVVTETGETFYQDGDLFIVSKDHVWEDE